VRKEQKKELNTLDEADFVREQGFAPSISRCDDPLMTSENRSGC